MVTYRPTCLWLLIIFILSLSYQASSRAAPDQIVKDDHDDHDSHDHDHDDSHDHSHEHAHRDEDHNHTIAGNGTKSDRFRWEPYVYGTLSVTFVSLLSLAGVIVIPFIKKKVAYDGVMLTFMALAVGTMTSDALLHLIPESLGMHDHGHEEGEEGHHHHHHEEEGHEDEHAYVGKMTALLGTLYGLYLLELIMHTAAALWKKPKIGQSTQHGGATVIKVDETKEASSTDGKWSLAGSNHGGHHHGHSHGGLVSETDDGHSTILGLKSYAFVIVLSDAMHNFTDGLAIGAAFSKSTAAGIGVSIAVICHEIPHEMGNFAILLNTGMGLKKALLLNFLSAVTCFAGLYPGIVAGQQEVLSRWIFAAVAAGFLYVALVHMSRELQSFGSLPWYLSFILQNLGMLVGFGVIFLLAIYEEDLNSIG